MRNVIVALLVFVLGFTSLANAQNVKTIEWDAFPVGIEYVDGEFYHGGRAIHEYVVVNVPGGTFGVRTFLYIDEGHDTKLYMATMSSRPVQVVGKETIVRVMFSCSLGGDEVCRQKLSDHVAKGFVMQSLGVANAEKGLPQNPILTFLVNTTGQFKF